jgi:hypothetical protein
VEDEPRKSPYGQQESVVDLKALTRKEWHMRRQGQLRIHGHGNVEVRYASEYLVDLERAYDSVLLFESIVDDASRLPRYLERWNVVDPMHWPWSLPRDGSSINVAEAIPYPDRLVLAGVRLNSPGFWDFLGALNPLEVVRKYLNDRHERRQDRDYRESAEMRRLALENLKLENEIIAERIKLAKGLGATDRHLISMLDQLVYQPLLALDRHQDRGVIEGAEITTLGENEKLG